MSRKSVLAMSALALSLALAGSIQQALAQDAYSYDNFQNAPPGSFLNNKVKPQASPAKSSAKAPVKGKTVAKPTQQPVAPQSGVYNSGQMVPGNSFNYPAQNQLGQSDFIQHSGGLPLMAMLSCNKNSPIKIMAAVCQLLAGSILAAQAIVVVIMVAATLANPWAIRVADYPALAGSILAVIMVAITW